MKKKIECIGIIEPVGGHGGMDYYDYGLAMGLASQNIGVILYTSSETALRNYDGVSTVLCFKRMWKRNFVIKTLKYLFGHIQAFHDLKRKGGEIVHLHFFAFRSVDFIVLLLSRIWGLGAIVTVHDVKSFNDDSNATFEKLCYRLIHGVIVHNSYSSEQIKKRMKADMPLAIIPHGNYLPFITPCSPLRFDQQMFSLLFFGQIKEVKGLDVLLEGLHRLRSRRPDIAIELTIAGKAWKSDLKKYTDMITSFDLTAVVKTKFRYIPDDEVISLFEKADLVVLPYKEIYQSGVLLLTMSYGRPVICSDLPAFAGIITDGVNGYTFRSEDGDDLSGKIERIADNRQEIKNIIENSNIMIENEFDWRKIGLDVLNFYNYVFIP